jgi:outer membrane protein TolC
MQRVPRTCRRALVSSALALLAALVLCLGGQHPGAWGQTSARLGFSPGSPAVPASPESLPPLVTVRLTEPQPGTVEQGPVPRRADAWPEGEARLLPINLGTALRLATTNNLDIAQAGEVVTRSQLDLERARLQFVPTMNLGSTYVDHEGTIQKTEGNIIQANRDSLFAGGGPSLTLSLADALFAPLVAAQTRAATQAGLQRVRNDTLLAVAETYFAMLRARRRLARVDATLDFLTSDRPSPVRAGSKGLLLVVQAMQEAGIAEALKAEVHRVQVEVLRRQDERSAALQDFRIAVAELARLLRLDPASPLWPIEDYRVPLELPGPWYEQPQDDLVRLALNNRPELAESQALVQAAVERTRNARYRPFLPNVSLNYGWGDFGGGPDLNPPIVVPATKTTPEKVITQPGFGPSGRITHFSPREDFDVTLMWRLQNMGLGNYTEIRDQEAQTRQARLRQIQIQDRIATEVVQTLELIRSWEERVATTRSAMFDKDGRPTGPVFEAIRLNFERVREVKTTRPLEVLDSLRGLSDLLDAYGQAITDYERARFRMWIVLGLPVEEIIGRLLASQP